jgi:hypothetical protein
MPHEEQVQMQMEADRAEYERLRREELARAQKPRPEKSISNAKFSFGMTLSVIGDGIDIITVGTIGWLTGLIIDGILALSFGISKKNRKQIKSLVIGWLLELIPIVGMFPFRSFAMYRVYQNSKKDYMKEMAEYNAKTA